MEFDLIIIGAGPGGYEMAAEAAHQGMNVALVERDKLGGTCLNRGCIPTKALCRNAEVVATMREAARWGVNTGDIAVDYAAAAARKDEVVDQLRNGVEMLLNSASVTIVNGEARLVDAHTVEVAGALHTAQHIVIATGSQPRGLPIPGAELAMTSDDLLAMTALPQSIVVVGGGVIGMEFAVIMHNYGVKVTVVEFCKEILPPFDADVAKRLRKLLSKRGIDIVTQAGVTAIEQSNQGFVVRYDSKGKSREVVAERVLMAVGRAPVIPAGAQEVGVVVGRRGIEVDEHMCTAVPNIYAIGDVNGHCMLAHAATAQGRVALAHMRGQACSINLDVVPSAVFTTPELAMVGLTEDQCEQRGIEVDVHETFFRSNGKALAMGEPDGLLKLIVNRATGRVEGCHICGAHAADIIQEVALAMSAGLTAEALATTIHGHPTLTEVLQQAALQVASK